MVIKARSERVSDKSHTESAPQRMVVLLGLRTKDPKDCCYEREQWVGDAPIAACGRVGSRGLHDCLVHARERLTF